MSVTDDDFRRKLVNPGLAHYASADEAAAVMRRVGYLDASPADVLVAVYSGEVYCGRHWDFKFPLGYVEPELRNRRGAASWVNLSAMRAAHVKGKEYQR